MFFFVLKEKDVEITTAPDNWLELDGLTLKGSYRLIIDKLMEALAEKNMEISAKSAVQLNKRDCLILWFPSSVEDETRAEWFDVTIKSLIAEVEPKYFIKLVHFLTKTVQLNLSIFNNRKPVKEEETEDELAEKIEGIELEEKPEHSDENPTGTEVTDEESDYQPIEFHLISDPDEKEALIKQLEKESSGEEEGEEETAAVEEAVEEEEEKQPEEEPVENVEENAVEIEEIAENIVETAEST